MSNEISKELVLLNFSHVDGKKCLVCAQRSFVVDKENSLTKAFEKAITCFRRMNGVEGRINHLLHKEDGVGYDTLYSISVRLETKAGGL